MISSINRALAALVLATLTACGGGASGPTATVSALVPADGATQVDIRPSMSITFDAALDAETVTADHVRLESTGFPLAVSVAYDAATHTVTVTPPTLAHDRRYTLTFTGLVDANGHALPDTRTMFSTWINSPTATTTPVAGTGQAGTLDASGHLQRWVWTAANLVASYADYAYDANGRLATITRHDGPGADGVWFTADDAIQSTETFAYDANGAQVLDALASATGSPGGQDWRIATAYDPSGTIVTQTRTDAGADGVLGTADDTVRYSQATTDPANFHVQTVYSDGAGKDGQLFTADDLTAYDNVDPGAGRTLSFDGAGADHRWMTGDDVVASETDLTYDARGNVIRSVRSETDVVSYVVYTYDAHDNRVSATSYGGPGPDGSWFTADDTIVSTTLYDTAH